MKTSESTEENESARSRGRGRTSDEVDERGTSIETDLLDSWIILRQKIIRKEGVLMEVCYGDIES